jgi:nucleoside-diphosphate-sugar epimerase
MKIIITGVMGYVGPLVLRHLRYCHPTAELIGFDSGFFAHNLTAAEDLPETLLNRLHFGDIREFPTDLLDGVDAVVHLAAVSNDPMGNCFEAVTEAINEKASIDLAERARARGVRCFVFASSCSIYGYAEGRSRREGDALNPLTAYARSKVAVERALGRSSEGMAITCLRFATACGMSDRLRLDLVLNDFVASALVTGEITILSDGTPWRPLIDVCDMAQAVEWAIDRNVHQGGSFLAINVGSNEGNYQVQDMARAVANALPSTRININPSAPPDKRSYQVDFSLFHRLAPAHQPKLKLAQSVENLYVGLRTIGFADTQFRSSSLVRLKALERHITEGRLSHDLRWQRLRDEKRSNLRK